MQVSVFQLLIGVLLWTSVMVMPPLISFGQNYNPMLGSILLTTVYPLTLSYFSRRSSFFVSPLVIVLSSLSSLLISLIVHEFTTNEKIMVTTQIIAFVLTLIILSTQIDMYGANVTN